MRLFRGYVTTRVRVRRARVAMGNEKNCRWYTRHDAPQSVYTFNSVSTLASSASRLYFTTTTPTRDPIPSAKRLFRPVLLDQLIAVRTPFPLRWCRIVLRDLVAAFARQIAPRLAGNRILAPSVFKRDRFSPDSYWLSRDYSRIPRTFSTITDTCVLARLLNGKPIRRKQQRNDGSWRRVAAIVCTAHRSTRWKGKLQVGKKEARV